MNIKLFKTTAITIALLVISLKPGLAIENLQVRVQGTDAILTWPSVEGETFIVRYRARLNEAHPWTILAAAYPAAAGTSQTSFTHTGIVEYPPGNGGGGGGGNPPPPEMSATATEISTTDTAKKPKDPPLPDLPPVPWDDRYVLSSDQTALLLQNTSTTEEIPIGAIGFYQVVRVGVHLYGISDGAVLSGQVPLPMEFGHPDNNAILSEVFLSNNGSDDNLPGSAFPPLPLEAGVALSGVWDTTHVPNGVYVLQVGARLDNDVVYLGQPVTVTVANVIWYPDPWEVGGEAIYVGAQTIYTSGSWHLDLYDDTDTYVGYLEGYIAADGYCNYPGIPGPGFSLNNTDGAGNQNPSTFYTLVMTLQPSVRAAASTSTRKVFIEPPWNIYTWSVVCYKQPFASWMPGHEDLFLLMQAVWNVEDAFHQNSLGNFVVPFEIQTTADWSTVTNSLASFVCRDFFYFGHGSGSTMGDASARLTLPQVQTLLGNNYRDPLTATNMHPYRFVFIDGCNTADGNWPQAFGIPKKEGMEIADFGARRGLRPRAFMGWNRKKVFGPIIGGNQLFPPHDTYIKTFWSKWAERDQGGGPANNITQAKTFAAGAAPNAALGMVIYGAKDLFIDF